VLDIYFRENAYLHPVMKILDAGCGTGVVTKVLYDLARRKGFADITFHGFDLTQAMLDIFRRWMDKEAIRDIQLKQADVLDLENQLLKDWAGYDLIVSSAMLEYIPREKLNQTLSSLTGHVPLVEPLIPCPGLNGYQHWAGFCWATQR
jgi:cyclopropane fatty-acyl-phospholipid synthase-like methyltransferase